MTSLLVLLSLTAGPAQAQSWTLSGRLQASDGGAVYNASITVYDVTMPGYRVLQIFTMQHDYALHLSRPGTYQVEYSAHGYDSTWYGGADTPASIVIDASGQASIGGRPVPDNTLDDVTLLPATPHPVSGEVVDDDGAPLSGVLVEAFDAEGSPTEPAASATTGEDGAYVIDLIAGYFSVRYTDPTERHYTGYLGGGPDRQLNVEEDGRLWLYGRLPCPSLCPVALISKPTVSGRVVDALGDPVAGVSVSVDPIGTSTDSGTATTASDGGYVVPVEPGTYQVTLQKTGWAGTRYGGPESPTTVTVADAGSTLDDVVLASTPFALSGSVTTADGPPSGVVVDVFPQGSTDPADLVDSQTVGSQGGYTVSLPVGRYDLAVRDDDAAAPAYVSTVLAEVTVGQDGALTVGGAPVATLPPVELTVSLATLPHDVVGSVADVLGAPVDGVTVRAVPVGSGLATTTTSGADDSLGDHGRFRLGLVPGSYELHAGGGADWLDTSYTGGDTSTALVTVQLNGAVLVNGVGCPGADLGQVEVQGRPVHVLRGSVAEGDHPLSGITVEAFVPGDLSTPVASTTSGPDGTWVLDGDHGVPVGTYGVKLSGASGGSTYDAAWFGGDPASEVVVAQDGVVSVAQVPVADATLGRVVLTRAPSSVTHPVVGTVVDVTGAPVSGLTVRAVPEGSGGAPTATTGPDGGYRLDLVPGAYDLGVDGGADWLDATVGTVTVQLDGTVLDGTTAVADGDLGEQQVLGSTAYPLHGAVAEGGHPLPGVTVSAYSPDDRTTPLATTTSGDDGRWTLGGADGLVVGTYVVRLTGADHDAAWFGGATATPVVVGQGGTVTVDGSPLAGAVLPTVTLTRTVTEDPTPDPTDAPTDPEPAPAPEPELAPTVVTAPVLSGTVGAGRTVTTTLGTWSVALAGRDVRVRWLLDGAPAGRWSSGAHSQRFTVPVWARSRRVSYRVVVARAGTRPAGVWTSRSYVVPKAVSRTRASLTRSRLTIAVTAPGAARPNGLLVIRDGRRVVRRARLRPEGEGVRVVRLVLPRGRHRLTVVYGGNRRVIGSTTRLTVSVPRR
ncbi:carboxypeptidase-like regulatory domain-containing protein [Nocardioides marmoribigeumensis]|uniref:Alpha-amylase n=1 Tax=Nocardioides marmoribigeumensis TaxID=433649 RepID=A0ABU2BPV4_9ACTN|nr:carboxypeptidase-like regulatory domain-containing protein [Nocardioides marmoribigeumensis]MDR7360642.1 hypothetical protein [Nocardioides marmoribigeumensis]